MHSFLQHFLSGTQEATAISQKFTFDIVLEPLVLSEALDVPRLVLKMYRLQYQSAFNHM